MVITVGNIKGGVGKSTIAFNTGMWLIESGTSIEFIDLDPQQTLNDTLYVRKESGLIPNINVAHKSIPNHISHDLDYVIDVSIADKEAMIKALSITDIVLIPCAPSQSDVWATGKFVDMLKLLYPKLNIFLFLNRADTNPKSQDNLETNLALSEIQNASLSSTWIYNRVSYRKSFSEGQSISELKKDKKAIEEFNKLMQEIFE